MPELDKRAGRRARATRAFDYHPDCASALAARATKYSGWLGVEPRTSPRRAPPADSDEESASDSDYSSD